MQVERIIHLITIKINLEPFTIPSSLCSPVIIHIRLQVTVKVNADPGLPLP